MRTIKYYQALIDSYQFYLAKEDDEYIFIGSDQKDITEIYQLIKGDFILQQGDKKEFQDALDQFTEYFNHDLTSFTLSIRIDGSDFQKSVYSELLKIPYGTLITYQDLAISLNKPQAVRAVANAIAKNPLLIIILCHRVIGSDGKLRGYRGGLPIKQKLISLEKRHS